MHPIGAATFSESGRTEPGELRVRSRRWRGQHIFETSGALSLRTRGPLVEALDDALDGDANQIVLDLRDLESIDHAGVDAILTAHLRASDELKLLVIVPGPAPVQRVLDAVQGPFLYATGHGSRAVGPARTRSRRAGLSSGTDRSGARTHSLRRLG